jgi:hypothetical protein
MIAKVIEQKINEFKVEITKLGQEIGEKLTRLKNGEFVSDKEVRQIEEEVSNKVSGEVANIELNDLMNQAQKILKGSVDSLRGQVEKLLKDLENFSQNYTTQQPKSGFFRPEIIIPLGLIVVVFGIGIVVFKKRKSVKKVN